MPLTFEDQNLSAWIEVDDTELPLYDVQTNDKEVSGWIPSEAGKHFVVKWSRENRAVEMCGDVDMDGKACGGKVMRNVDGTHFTHSGVRTSPTTEKPFLFSPLELTDDEEYLSQKTSGLGEIKLMISLATFGASVDSFVQRDLVEKVHERSKKAMGHKVSLGEPTQVAHVLPITTTRNGTLATFIFRYRPIGAEPLILYFWLGEIFYSHEIDLDMLRANGIVPQAESKKRAAEQIGGEVVDLTGDLSDDEDERRVRSLREELAKLERKRRKTTHVKSEPGIKPEPGSSSARSSRTVSLGVIDLT
ncbi:hypothetical protein D9757_004954 [Collybiopsis confluens]|uniref:DUF7918 domain-containing protein n=1 Tax=Collybiopsis confluens TaxID=2823264 RepID=A0A8H5HTA2_9AGAR|nr:hypothetical protein D9757_004954 [Collybiopsis confluens]